MIVGQINNLFTTLDDNFQFSRKKQFIRGFLGYEKNINLKDTYSWCYDTQSCKDQVCLLQLRSFPPTHILIILYFGILVSGMEHSAMVGDQRSPNRHSCPGRQWPHRLVLRICLTFFIIIWYLMCRVWLLSIAVFFLMRLGILV